MVVLKLLKHLLIFALLTILTQIGGIVYLLSFYTDTITDQLNSNSYARYTYRLAGFVVLYLVISFTVVPPIAKMFGRVPLPVFKTNHVEPINIITCIANRHYVRPKLRNITFEIGQKLHSKFPGATVKYMDANFPFMNHFPLIPHLSHHDGKKLDVAFCYVDKATGAATNAYPPHIAYGVSEEPLPNEYDRPQECVRKGYPYYVFMSKMVSKGDKDRFAFDVKSNAYMVNLFINQPAISKILIEPHLKSRLGLKSGKVRLHQCGSVRHDDHIHVQI